MTALPTANAAARSVSASGTAAAITPIAIIPMVTATQIDGRDARAEQVHRDGRVHPRPPGGGEECEEDDAVDPATGSPCIVCAIWPM